MDERLRNAYVTALTAQHEGARVEIHLGARVLDHLEAMATYPMSHGGPRRFGGFPVKSNPDDDEHISVHSVTIIH